MLASDVGVLCRLWYVGAVREVTWTSTRVTMPTTQHCMRVVLADTVTWRPVWFSLVPTFTQCLSLTVQGLSCQWSGVAPQEWPLWPVAMAMIYDTLRQAMGISGFGHTTFCTKYVPVVDVYSSKIIFMPLPNVVWPEAYCFCSVHPCLRLSLCSSRNIVNMISCRVLDMFSQNLCQCCIMGQKWML